MVIHFFCGSGSVKKTCGYNKDVKKKWLGCQCVQRLWTHFVLSNVSIPWWRSSRCRWWFPPGDTWGSRLSPGSPSGWRAGRAAVDRLRVKSHVVCVFKYIPITSTVHETSAWNGTNEIGVLQFLQKLLWCPAADTHIPKQPSPTNSEANIWLLCLHWSVWDQTVSPAGARGQKEKEAPRIKLNIWGNNTVWTFAAISLWTSSWTNQLLTYSLICSFVSDLKLASTSPNQHMMHIIYFFCW